MGKPQHIREAEARELLEALILTEKEKSFLKDCLKILREFWPQLRNPPEKSMWVKESKGA